MKWTLSERPIMSYEYQASNLKSGDVLAIFRLDGVDPLIMYGTGSTIGHCTMALWFDGELYIVEAQDSPYWPTKNVQRTKYRDWVKYALAADFHVSHLALTEEARAIFNETAAQEFFFSTEGLPYGFHNFLYGWIDDVNIAPLLPVGGVLQVFSIFEKHMPSVADVFITESLNKRLNTTGLKIPQIAIEAAKLNISSSRLITTPAQDNWVYSSIKPRDGEAYVCSSYIVAHYKAAGLFGNLTVQATEFTPRDLYELSFFDNKWVSQDLNCLSDSPGMPFCQIMGKYRMAFPKMGTVEPYSNMNERCKMLAPLYER